ncbi:MULTISPECIES: penicillin-binding protein 1A [Cellulophaga]|uniref:Peptidoglycan glycosyltransferase n=1 Tax=Cellulophaga lytica (strain ATCC 23178 / DSM 7489 / JCM 8516 / NBRC 14961 / NCIMB 1423 / VKM B-1433 / Cy l20) TaxID=867900 RepID=F0RHX6_CELLC|nr:MULTISPECIES: transglycosylase domain-containing protein [Cellulophaga]ADY29238.1 Peptidoglycan glycosyltransferase [Cellulophaga lytica DSM 7489]MDO6852041.1 transglycosylase domain-containing protein [Cellulophaga lytica]TVZ08190.1 penicillin-binding protein 1A [Cellulophaga sp. RHA_52]WQG76587.1 transglycosylase domain-containing protein [Cellulophaga lytica]
MAKAVKKKESKPFFKFIKWFWILFVVGIISVVLIFLLASMNAFGELPDFERLENPQTNLASQIISSDGELLGKYYFEDNRTDVAYEQLPKHLVDALVATEDARYFEHSGIDARGTLRAFFYLGKKGGASTISQQLAKQLFTGQAARGWQRYTQKIKEWVIATRLERQYTKEEIIAMYFNIYDFGNNADGIRSASRIYFGKEPKDLDVKESAMLVGMFKNSSLYNPTPKRNPEGTLNRRNVVLAQMAKYGYITQKEKDSLQKTPLSLNFSPENHKEGLATYFRMYLQGFMSDWAKKNPKPALKGERDKWNLFLDGLKIYTTIDSRMQKNAEVAVERHMTKLQAEFFVQNTPERNKTAPFLDLNKDEVNRILERGMKTSDRWRSMKRNGKSEKEIRAAFKKPIPMKVFSWTTKTKNKDTVMSPLDSIRYHKSFLRTAMMSMEPQTGHVKAWVGGINYKYFQYDNVYSGSRQAGSTFKPFVYAAAIDQLRLSPCDSIMDTQHCIAAGKHGNTDAWCPKNSDGKYSGEMMTLKKALAKSVNSVTAKLIDEVGPAPVVQMAKKLGITKELPEVPSIALGTADMSVYEMVGAYGAFANQGVYVKPVMVTRIEDKNGTVLYEYTPETRDVMSKDVAYAVVNLMEGVTNEGSGARLRSGSSNAKFYKEVMTGHPYELSNPIAGKTGTTQNQSDGWFMGMVPNLVTGVWVGGEDRATHFRSIRYGQGATMALPIWGMYMKANYADKDLGISDKAFTKPKNLSINVDCAKVRKEMQQDQRVDDDIEDLDF